jgi:hypothetical protein
VCASAPYDAGSAQPRRPRRALPPLCHSSPWLSTPPQQPVVDALALFGPLPQHVAQQQAVVGGDAGAAARVGRHLHQRHRLDQAPVGHVRRRLALVLRVGDGGVHAFGGARTCRVEREPARSGGEWQQDREPGTSLAKKQPLHEGSRRGLR